MNLRRRGSGSSFYPLAAELVLGEQRTVLDVESFQRMISLERKRTDRSGKPFLLMLIKLGDETPSASGKLLGELIQALSRSVRDTDLTGWYKDGEVGVMFTEVALDDRGSVLSAMIQRVSETLRNNLSFEQFNQVTMSFHVYPEEWNRELPQRPSHRELYPDLSRRDAARKFSRTVKRAMDLVGSLAALILLAPLFLLIGIAIKVTSKGPVFFRQQRIGQHGVPFVFLKFRSMRVNNDASTHKEYVKEFIAGRAELKPSNGNGTGVYKLTEDNRVTRVGALLRRTSLDELPQFWNVLKGEMSLVGPRPPVIYEVENYQPWHRRRLLEAKPGLTGLWQVNGRSRVKFDEMVRLDLRYARNWSPWMDFKIILRTPAALVSGGGAY